MARPSIPVDVIGNTAQLRRQIEELSKTPVVLNIQGAGGRAARGLEQQAGAISNIGTGLAAGNAAATSFNRPLGKISGNVSEIDKSLGAANARVIAFGAAAGGIFALQNAVGQLFTSFVNTEKKLAEINTVLNLDTGGLQSFGKQIFKTAGQTGQSFDTASEAALEFSRQGLGVEETTKRTRDALILSRLSGLDAASSVDALTASVNSYRKEGITTGQVVNKLANVDAGFAVSSADLAEALSRVGSSAQDAGVSFDELIALVTSAQQTTARGGAVIGNSLKTIFTRLNREKTTELFGDLGISTLDEQGNEKNQIALLKDLAGVYSTLGTQQKNAVAEQVGGVFQLNILKAALSDLGRQYSVYDRALNTSVGSTDQAYKRNERLNQTLSGLGTQTLANVQSAASTIGGELFQPAAKNVLKIGNFLAESVNESDGTSVGAKLGQGVISGLGSFLGGPGLALIGAVLAKLFADFGKYGSSAAKSLLGLDQAAKNQATIQQSVGAYLQKNASLFGAIASGQTSVTAAAKQYLNVINQQSQALQAQAAIAKQVAAAVAANVGKSATPAIVSGASQAQTPKKASRFAGFIPNFAAMSERDYYQSLEDAGADSHKAGYRASILKGVTVHDGFGNSERAWMTSRESKKTFTNAAGYKATMITPPNGFSASTMVASSGFIPNFAAFRGAVTSKEIALFREEMIRSGRAGYLKNREIELTDQDIAKELRKSTAPLENIQGKNIQESIDNLTREAQDRFLKKVQEINQKRQIAGLKPLTEERIARLQKAGAAQPTQSEWNALYSSSQRKIGKKEFEAALKQDAEKRAAGEFGKKGEGFIASPKTPENQVINLGDLSSKPAGISLVHASKAGPKSVVAQTPIDKKRGNKAYRASVMTSGIDESVIKGALPDTKKRMEDATVQLASDFARSLGLKSPNFSAQDIPNTGSIVGAAGAAFEQALTGFVQRSTKQSEGARVDFADPTNLRKFFHNIPGLYEAKQNPSPKLVQDIIRKYIDTNAEFKAEALKAQSPGLVPVRKASQPRIINQKDFDQMYGLEGAAGKKQLQADLSSGKIKINDNPYMQEYSSGFIPNFASLINNREAEQRAFTAEGSGAVLDEYRGMPYVRKSYQSSNFKTMMKQDHPEGLKAAVQNSAAAQGLSRGFIPNFAPNEDGYDGGLTASMMQSLLMTLAFTLPQRGTIAEGIKEEKIKNAKAYAEIRAQNLKAEARKIFDQKKTEARISKQAILEERKSGKITQRQAVDRFAQINKTLSSADESLKKSFTQIDEGLQKSSNRLLTNEKYLSRVNQIALKEAGATSRSANLFGKAASFVPGVSQERAAAGFAGFGQSAKGAFSSAAFKGPGAAIGAAMAAPIIAETVAAELGRDTASGRIASATGNAASFALTGAAIGGVKGLAVGGLVGAGMLASEIATARGSTLAKTSKESEKATAESARINDLASQAMSDMSDYYEAVGEAGPESKKAKQIKKQLTNTISKFGPGASKKLFEAFYAGPEKFQEEAAKQQTEAIRREKAAKAGESLSAINEETRARKSGIGFAYQGIDLLFGQETKGGFRGYTSQKEKEDISGTIRDALYGGLGSEERLQKIETDFGGVSSFVGLLAKADQAARDFEKKAQEANPLGLGGKSLEEVAQIESSSGRALAQDSKAFLNTINETKKQLLAFKEKGLGAPLSESGRTAFLESVDSRVIQQLAGDVSKDINESRGIIKEEQDVRVTRGESNASRVAKQMAKIQSEMEGYSSRGGETFAEIISTSQQERLAKLQEARMAGPSPEMPSRAEENEMAKQKRLQRSQRRLDFLQQYGVKGSKVDMQAIIQEAYQARMAEAQDLGIANIPGLQKQIYQNIERQVFGFAGRGDEIAQREADQLTEFQRRQREMPEYTATKSEYGQKISGYSTEQLAKEQSMAQSNLGIQQELLSRMRGEAGLTGEGAAQQMIKEVDREIQDMGPVYSGDAERQKQMQDLIDRRTQLQNYSSQLSGTTNDYSVLKGQEAGSQLMIESIQEALRKIQTSTSGDNKTGDGAKDGDKDSAKSGEAVTSAANKISSASETAAAAMSTFANSAESASNRLLALSITPTVRSGTEPTAALGFVPNFALPSTKNINATKQLESFASARPAKYYTSPFPHVRNTSQPTFESAMRDHGGLSNALNDSANLQAAFAAFGMIPNFANFDMIKNDFYQKSGFGGVFDKISKVESFVNNFRAPEVQIPNFAYNPEMVPGNAPTAMKKAFANIQEVIAIVSQNLGFNAGQVNAPTSISSGKYGEMGRALAAVTTSPKGEKDVWFSNKLGEGLTLGTIANEATHVNQGLNILNDKNSYSGKLKSFTDFLESKGMVTATTETVGLGNSFSDNRIIAGKTTSGDSLSAINKKKEEIQKKADSNFKKESLASQEGLSAFAKNSVSSLSEKVKEESNNTSLKLKDQYTRTLDNITKSFDKNKSIAEQERLAFDRAETGRRSGIGSEFQYPRDAQAYETERLSSLMNGLIGGIQVGNINANDLVSSGAAKDEEQAMKMIETVFGAKKMLEDSGIKAARGFIPAFSKRDIASAVESHQANSANYRDGILKTLTAHDGTGNSFKIYANSRETITKGKNAFGYKATMIEPPNGFNFAAQGFIPNFAPPFGMTSSYDPETEALRRIISGTEAAPAPDPVLSPKMREFVQANRLNYTIAEDGTAISRIQDASTKAPWGGNPRFESPMDYSKYIPKEENILTRQGSAFYDDMAGMMSGTAKLGVGKAALRALPLVGLGLGAYGGVTRALRGDTEGALMEIGAGVSGMLPGWGTAVSLALSGGIMARDMALTQKERDSGVSIFPDSLRELDPIDHAFGITDYNKTMREGMAARASLESKGWKQNIPSWSNGWSTRMVPPSDYDESSVEGFTAPRGKPANNFQQDLQAALERRRALTGEVLPNGLKESSAPQLPQEIMPSTPAAATRTEIKSAVAGEMRPQGEAANSGEYNVSPQWQRLINLDKEASKNEDINKLRDQFYGPNAGKPVEAKKLEYDPNFAEKTRARISERLKEGGDPLTIAEEEWSKGIGRPIPLADGRMVPYYPIGFENPIAGRDNVGWSESNRQTIGRARERAELEASFRGESGFRDPVAPHRWNPVNPDRIREFGSSPNTLTEEYGFMGQDENEALKGYVDSFLQANSLQRRATMAAEAGYTGSPVGNLSPEEMLINESARQAAQKSGTKEIPASLLDDVVPREIRSSLGLKDKEGARSVKDIREGAMSNMRASGMSEDAINRAMQMYATPASPTSAQAAPAAKPSDSATATAASGEYPVLPQPDRPFIDAGRVAAQMSQLGQQSGGEANRFLNSTMPGRLSNAQVMGIMAETYFGSDKLPGMGYTEGSKPAEATASISAPAAGAPSTAGAAGTPSTAGASIGISSLAAGANADEGSSMPTIGGSSEGLMADAPQIDAARATAQILRQGQQMGGEANRFVNAGTRYEVGSGGQLIKTGVSNAEAMGVMAETYFGSDSLPGMGYTHGRPPKRLRDFDPWGNNLIGGAGAAATLSTGGDEPGLWSNFLNREGNWEKRRWPDEDAQKWANDPDSGSMGAIVRKQLREQQEKQAQQRADLMAAAEREFQQTGKWPSVEEISAKDPSMSRNMGSAPQVTRKVYPGDPLNYNNSDPNFKPTEYTTGNNGKYVPMDEAPAAPILPSSAAAPVPMQQGATAPVPMSMQGPSASAASYMNGVGGGLLSFGYSNPQTPQGGYGMEKGTDLSDNSIYGIQQGMEAAIKNTAASNIGLPALGAPAGGAVSTLPYAAGGGFAQTQQSLPASTAPTTSMQTSIANPAGVQYQSPGAAPVYDFGYTASKTPAPVGATQGYQAQGTAAQPMSVPATQSPPQPTQEQPQPQQSTNFQSLEQAIKSAEQTIKTSEQSVKSAENAVRELANKNQGGEGKNASVTLDVNVDVDPPEVTMNVDVNTDTLSEGLADLPGQVYEAIAPSLEAIKRDLETAKNDIKVLFSQLSNKV